MPRSESALGKLTRTAITRAFNECPIVLHTSALTVVPCSMLQAYLLRSHTAMALTCKVKGPQGLLELSRSDRYRLPDV